MARGLQATSRHHSRSARPPCGRRTRERSPKRVQQTWVAATSSSASSVLVKAVRNTPSPPQRAGHLQPVKRHQVEGLRQDELARRRCAPGGMPLRQRRGPGSGAVGVGGWSNDGGDLVQRQHLGRTVLFYGWHGRTLGAGAKVVRHARGLRWGMGHRLGEALAGAGLRRSGAVVHRERYRVALAHGVGRCCVISKNVRGTPAFAVYLGEHRVA
jgi:hypothetical protein